jgi:hypothetical protein
MAVTAGINFETFENAIHAWVSNATDLTTIWADQAAPIPDYPYCSLRILSGPTEVSQNMELRHTFDSGRPLGQEIEYNACVPVTIIVTCQAYVLEPESRAALTQAQNVLTQAKTALALPSYITTLQDSDIAVIDRGVVQNISALINSATISRATMDVTFGTSFNAVEYAGYIDKVRIKSTAFKWDYLVDGS